MVQYVEEEGRNAGVCVIADILVGLLACWQPSRVRKQGGEFRRISTIISGSYLSYSVASLLYCMRSVRVLAPVGVLLWGPKLGQSNDSGLCRNLRRSFITFMGWSLLRQRALSLRNSVKLPKRNLRVTFSIHWRNLFWITWVILCENRACLFIYVSVYLCVL